jgi:hypothetical protein
VLHLVPTPAQQELYQLFLQLCEREGQRNLFSMYTLLKRLLNAPRSFEELMQKALAGEQPGQAATVAAGASTLPPAVSSCSETAPLRIQPASRSRKAALAR